MTEPAKPEKLETDPYFRFAPKGSNADEWALFLETNTGRIPYMAVQIAEAIEDAEQYAIERAVSRMGWDEIKAYEEEWHKTQGGDDAGGYYLRCLARLFGIKRPLRCFADLHRRGMVAMVQQAAGTRK